MEIETFSLRSAFGRNLALAVFLAIASPAAGGPWNGFPLSEQVEEFPTWPALQAEFKPMSQVWTAAVERFKTVGPWLEIAGVLYEDLSVAITNAFVTNYTETVVRGDVTNQVLVTATNIVAVPFYVSRTVGLHRAEWHYPGPVDFETNGTTYTLHPMGSGGPLLAIIDRTFLDDLAESGVFRYLGWFAVSEMRGEGGTYDEYLSQTVDEQAPQGPPAESIYGLWKRHDIGYLAVEPEADKWGNIYGNPLVAVAGGDAYFTTIPEGLKQRVDLGNLSWADGVVITGFQGYADGTLFRFGREINAYTSAVNAADRIIPGWNGAQLGRINMGSFVPAFTATGSAWGVISSSWISNATGKISPGAKTWASTNGSWGFTRAGQLAGLEGYTPKATEGATWQILETYIEPEEFPTLHVFPTNGESKSVTITGWAFDKLENSTTIEYAGMKLIGKVVTVAPGAEAEWKFVRVDDMTTTAGRTPGESYVFGYTNAEGTKVSSFPIASTLEFIVPALDEHKVLLNALRITWQPIGLTNIESESQGTFAWSGWGRDEALENGPTRTSEDPQWPRDWIRYSDIPVVTYTVDTENGGDYCLPILVTTEGGKATWHMKYDMQVSGTFTMPDYEGCDPSFTFEWGVSAGSASDGGPPLHCGESAEWSMSWTDQENILTGLEDFPLITVCSSRYKSTLTIESFTISNIRPWFEAERANGAMAIFPWDKWQTNFFPAVVQQVTNAITVYMSPCGKGNPYYGEYFVWDDSEFYVAVPDPGTVSHFASSTLEFEGVDLLNTDGIRDPNECPFQSAEDFLEVGLGGGFATFEWEFERQD